MAVRDLSAFQQELRGRYRGWTQQTLYATLGRFARIENVSLIEPQGHCWKRFRATGLWSLGGLFQCGFQCGKLRFEFAPKHPGKDRLQESQDPLHLGRPHQGYPGSGPFLGKGEHSLARPDPATEHPVLCLVSDPVWRLINDTFIDELGNSQWAIVREFLGRPHSHLLVYLRGLDDTRVPLLVVFDISDVLEYHLDGTDDVHVETELDSHVVFSPRPPVVSGLLGVDHAELLHHAHRVELHPIFSDLTVFDTILVDGLNLK